METVIVAIIGALVTIVLTALGYWGARKSGLGATQEKLIANLKDLVDANEDKIKILEDEGIERERRLGLLEIEVKSLRRLTIKQAKVITKLLNGGTAEEKRAYAEAELGEF